MLAQRGQNLITCLLAAAADLGADAAVFHVLAVPLALSAADKADLGTRMEDRSPHRHVKLGLAGDDLANSAAHIGAGEVKADAAHKPVAHLFSKARISAGGASLRAIKAGLNTLLQHGAI